MKYLFSFLFSAFFIISNAQSQKNVPLLKYEDLEKKIQTEGKDKFLVVNFWSTTCAPCVKELPHFEMINAENAKNPNFKMILVSLDRAKDLEKVKKFISEKKLSAEVLLLDDIKRMNTWIPRFDIEWDGVIPVTVFYKNGSKVDFNNGEMSHEELEKIVKKYLN